MSSKLIFVRRTQKEVELFGGVVFVDIDGKNVGQLSYQDLTIEVMHGEHHIKMYKTHTYNTIIGIAEVDIVAEEGKILTFLYTAPMTVSQPGHIMVNDFVSYEEIDNLTNHRERVLQTEKRHIEYDTYKREEESKKSHTRLIIWIVIIPVAIAILWWLIEMQWMHDVINLF